jgi:hypothetical protein
MSVEGRGEDRKEDALPAVQEAEVIDVEVVDDGRGRAGEGVEDAVLGAGGAAAQLMASLQAAAKQRLVRWVIRTALWGGVLGLFATEHTWARVALWIWGPIALLSLGFNLFLWRLAKRGGGMVRGFGFQFGGPPR